LGDIDRIVHVAVAYAGRPRGAGGKSEHQCEGSQRGCSTCRAVPVHMTRISHRVLPFPVSVAQIPAPASVAGVDEPRLTSTHLAAAASKHLPPVCKKPPGFVKSVSLRRLRGGRAGGGGQPASGCVGSAGVLP